MDDANLAKEHLGKAERIVDSPTIISANSAQHFVPERATRLAIDPDRIEPTTANRQVSFTTNARSPAERRFRTVGTIAFLVSLTILGILYGFHLAVALFAELTVFQPALGWVYALALAVMVAILATGFVRLMLRYRTLKNVTGLQLMARSAFSRRLVDHVRARHSILDYLDDLQTRGDPQMKRSIEQLRTKFGQYSGEAARDFSLFNALVLEPIDRQVDARLSDCALQVAVATALATRLFDPLIVGVQAVRVVRETATAYRGRPGFLGTLELLTRAVSAAVFAEAADLLADAASQLTGTKAAAKLGARLGEGLTNGFVMCRLGEATKRLCRPVPLPPPDYSHSLAKLVRGLLFQGKDEARGPATGSVAM
jgi:uncharacterized membrane protein YcjF (UPF0283 family)